MRGVKFVDLRGILSSWWTRAALKVTPVVFPLKMMLGFSILALSLSLCLSLHISLSMEVVGGVVVWWVANQWKRVAAVSGCQQQQ